MKEKLIWIYHNSHRKLYKTEINPVLVNNFSPIVLCNLIYLHFRLTYKIEFCVNKISEYNRDSRQIY